MKIITWDEIRRGTLAIVLVIIPTVLLGTYIGSALQRYQITGPDLWQLKRTHVPDEVSGAVSFLSQWRSRTAILLLSVFSLGGAAPWLPGTRRPASGRAAPAAPALDPPPTRDIPQVASGFLDWCLCTVIFLGDRGSDSDVRVTTKDV